MLNRLRFASYVGGINPRQKTKMKNEITKRYTSGAVQMFYWARNHVGMKSLLAHKTTSETLSQISYRTGPSYRRSCI